MDTYLRKRAKDNLAKGPASLTDVISYEPQERVHMRFTDVQTQPQPIQPQACAVPPPISNAKVKKPKREREGRQEIGIVQ